MLTAQGNKRMKVAERISIKFPVLVPMQPNPWHLDCTQSLELYQTLPAAFRGLQPLDIKIVGWKGVRDK